MKKILIIILCLYSNAAFSCNNFIAKSEIPNAIALVPDTGAKACDKKDPCICFDGIIWEAATWDGTTLSNDPDKVNTFKESKRIRKQQAAAKQAEKEAAIISLKEKVNSPDSVINSEDTKQALKLILESM